jgi:predicted DsbA family dithiol-disulfide isomerase
VVIVEYLNAYCPHCRATHRRLEKVLAEMDVATKRLRIYTWGGNEYPVWARACVFAESQGLEERVFEELLNARNQSTAEVYAAAQRAGLDVALLQKALQDGTPPPRLVRHRKIFRAAHLEGLPTLDIGRRRLMGEQSEAELKEAVSAALPAGAR